MQIVIDINDKLYDRIKYLEPTADTMLDKLMRSVQNGTPLPKHGRLIDADAFAKKLEYASKRQKYKELLIKDLLTVDDVFEAVIESLKNEGLAEGDAPTIIEADKEYEAEMITYGNCMICGKELDEGLFFCKKCEAKVESEVQE